MIERYCMWCTASHNHQPMPHPEGAYALYAEAHEQIEKLRAENERLRELLQQWLDEAHELARAAVLIDDDIQDRTRAALRGEG